MLDGTLKNKAAKTGTSLWFICDFFFFVFIFLEPFVHQKGSVVVEVSLGN